MDIEGKIDAFNVIFLPCLWNQWYDKSWETQAIFQAMCAFDIQIINGQWKSNAEVCQAVFAIYSLGVAILKSFLQAPLPQ